MTRIISSTPLPLPTLAFLTLLAFSRIEAQPTPLPASGTTATADYRHSLEQETFFLINHYREENKLPPLQWNGAIAQLARAHSLDMATGRIDFGHDGFSDRIDRLKTALLGLRGAGENVFKTDKADEVARMAVDIWLHSPHHLENIRGDYNYSGLGVWQNEQGMIYFTQIFAKVPPQAHEAQAQPSSPPRIVTSFGMLATPQTRTEP